MPAFFQITLAVFWLMAFSSATHDIAADGFYMLALPQHEQAALVGVRSTFYRLAMIAGQGGLVFLAGRLTEMSGNAALAWSVVMFVLAALFVVLGVYHHFILPRPTTDHATRRSTALTGDFFATFKSFFGKKDILLILAFLLTYRLGEAQLLKLATPFMLDPVIKGGLGLTTAQVGVVYGTIGILALTLGGLAGGFAIAKFGLKRMLWMMVLSVHVPDLVFVFLSATQPENLTLIGATIAAEQFGYGFGFAAYLLYMIMVSEGENKTAHYAICTGFMALGMMLPGMVSGWIQSQLGYLHFFIWVCVATVPAFVVAACLKIDPEFGKKAEKTTEAA
jgi:PAT family beta-lactamase induction signal transducer AmpG